MNSFKINVAHLAEHEVSPLSMNLYEVEVFHMVGIISEIKAKPAVFYLIDGNRLMNECYAVLNSISEAPTLSRQNIAP